jgi:serine/threonine protein kinase
MELIHQVGETIAERYRILKPLGKGGSGMTYEAEDLNTGQRVALKALSLRHSRDWKQLELFEREADILKQLNHPAIPSYLDYVQVDTVEDRAFYIAQELAEGKSLAERVAQGWRTTEQEVRKIAAQILDILIYLHAFDPPVIHRDIKPQNVILSDNGKISLVDFGAVQSTYRSSQVRSSTVVGTYGYMAPEQFRGQALPATDLYGLGTTLLFLLTHRSPSDLPQERLRIHFRKRVQVSDPLAEWLEKLLEPDVEDRFASAQAALIALQQKVLVRKTTQPVPQQVWLGSGLAGVIAVVLLVIFRYPVAALFGIAPRLCEASPQQIRHYLNHGGTLHLKDNTSLLACVISRYSPEQDQQELRELIDFLLLKGADINANSVRNFTPLVSAIHRGNTEIAKFLVAKGADVNGKSFDNSTPLVSAIHGGNTEIAKFLIANGADVNGKSWRSYTPLLVAAGKGDTELVNLLIANRADINGEDSYGSTPLQVAVQRGHPEIVELLRSYGARE